MSGANDKPRVVLSSSLKNAFRAYTGEWKEYIRDPENLVEIVKKLKAKPINVVGPVYEDKLVTLINVPSQTGPVASPSKNSQIL